MGSGFWAGGQELRRQQPYPPLQKTQGRGTHSFATGEETKPKAGPPVLEHATWLKIRNQQYSQWAGREELFERERERDPDFQVWDGCALASEKVANEESRERNV